VFCDAGFPGQQIPREGERTCLLGIPGKENLLEFYTEKLGKQDSGVCSSKESEI